MTQTERVNDVLGNMETPIATILGLGRAVRLLAESEEPVPFYVFSALGDAIATVSGNLSDYRDSAQREAAKAVKPRSQGLRPNG